MGAITEIKVIEEFKFQEVTYGIYKVMLHKIPRIFIRHGYSIRALLFPWDELPVEVTEDVQEDFFAFKDTINS